MSISYRKYLQTTRKNKSKINTPDYVAFLEAEVKKKTNESELKTKPIRFISKKKIFI